MRFYLFFIIAISLLSCDDGDFDQIQFNFDSKINVCGEYLMYRTSSEKKEALILVVSKEDIVNEVGEVTIPITANNIVYRIFSDKVGTDYFCASIPPAQPTVTKEWLAVSGTANKISIITTEILNETGTITGYKHEIGFHNLILENNDLQERYTFYKFGDFETAIGGK